MAVETEFQEEEREAKKKSSKWQSFVTFLYDKQTGKVLGRTGISWLQIFVFYIVFYAFLAAFFAICLVVFLQTLDNDVPKYYGKGSILGNNPGMGFQPWLPENPESTLISFNKSDPSTYERYVNRTMEFINLYRDKDADTRNCSGDATNADMLKKDSKLKPCNFYNMISKEVLESKDKDGCNEANSFGYPDGEPCIMITMNKIIDWRPVSYPTDSVPDLVANRYKPGSIAVDCAGEFPQDYVGDVTYYPPRGIDGRFFPYRKSPKGYQQPFVFAKFKGQLGKVTKGVLAMVQCNAYAYNAVVDQGDRTGNVHFELHVDE